MMRLYLNQPQGMIMFINREFFSSLYFMPKNQERILSRLVSSWDTNTNIGSVSFERLTPTQRKRLSTDLRTLSVNGLIKRYPVSRYTNDMRVQSLKVSGAIKFYMVNPLYMRTLASNQQELMNLWQLLR